MPVESGRDQTWHTGVSDLGSYPVKEKQPRRIVGTGSVHGRSCTLGIVAGAESGCRTESKSDSRPDPRHDHSVGSDSETSLISEPFLVVDFIKSLRVVHFNILPQPLRSIGHSVPTTDELVPVTATVDLAALRHNVRVLQERADGADLMAVVKADAYGHGAIPVAKILREEGVRHFAVARPAEGVRLREAGLSDRILVLGAPFPDQLSVYTAHDLDATISSLETVEAACQHGHPARPIRAHVKVDTGMGRIGLSTEDAPEAISRLSEASGVTLAGIWTHFATADQPESAFAQTQLSRFEAVLETIDTSHSFSGRVHAANTGALLTIGARAHDFSTPLVRTGIAVYGLAASAELHARLDLHPVMTLSARVTHVKTVEPDTPISYGARWRATQTTRIATLGVGYGDGYPRLCSGRATARIAGEDRPIVGTICMDMCMVNLGPPDQPPAAEVEVGDEAIVFGPTGPTLYDVADWAETIPYEICCGISPRVPRRYVDSTSDERALPTSHDPTSNGLSSL